MTKEAQRIAIAQMCGWTNIHQDKDGTPWGKHPTHNHHTATLPDYLNDLNAMHKAEKTLVRENDPKLIFAYCETLCKLNGVINSVAAFVVVCSPAHKRAEAFLRVKGLWTE